MPKFLVALTILMPALLSAQVPHRTGSVHTPDVDLSYETFGSQGAEIPLIAVNGGPGLSHAYMMQNDLWQHAAAHRLVVLYDRRGTGDSKQVQPNAPQSMEAQVADLDAIRSALSLDRIAVLGDSYGGMIAMAYAAAHPERVSRFILSDSAAPSWKTMVHLLPQVCALRSSRAGDPGEGQQNEHRGHDYPLPARPRVYGDDCFPGNGCLIISAGENRDNEAL